MSARPVEVITTTERRRSYTDAERAAILAECAEPGTVIAQVARRHGIAESLIYGWRSRQRLDANVAAEPLQFVAYGTVADAPAPAAPVPVPEPARPVPPPAPAAAPSAPAPRPASSPPPGGVLRPAPCAEPGAIVVDLPTGVRLTVDAYVNERALLRVLRVLGEAS